MLKQFTSLKVLFPSLEYNNVNPFLLENFARIIYQNEAPKNLYNKSPIIFGKHNDNKRNNSSDIMTGVDIDTSKQNTVFEWSDEKLYAIKEVRRLQTSLNMFGRPYTWYVYHNDKPLKGDMLIFRNWINAVYGGIYGMTLIETINTKFDLPTICDTHDLGKKYTGYYNMISSPVWYPKIENYRAYATTCNITQGRDYLGDLTIY